MIGLLAFAAMTAQPISLAVLIDAKLPAPEVKLNRELVSQDSSGPPVDLRLSITTSWGTPDGQEAKTREAGRVRLARGETNNATLNPQFLPTPKETRPALENAIRGLLANGGSPDDVALLVNAVQDAARTARSKAASVRLRLDPNPELKEPEEIAATFVLGHYEAKVMVTVEIKETLIIAAQQSVGTKFRVQIPVATHLIPAGKPLNVLIHRHPKAADIKLEEGFGALKEGEDSGVFYGSGQPILPVPAVERAFKPGTPADEAAKSGFAIGIEQKFFGLGKTTIYTDYSKELDKRFENTRQPVVSGDGFTQLNFDGSALTGLKAPEGAAYGFAVGMIWLPTNPAYQSMLNLESLVFVPPTFADAIGQPGQLTKKIRAACLEFHKKPPGPGVAYYPARLNDPGLTLMAQRLVPYSQDVRMVQAAVWTYMDHSGPMEILDRLAGGLSAAAYVRGLKLIDESAGLSEDLLADKDVLHPVLLSVYGLTDEELDWFLPLMAGRAPSTVASALSKPGANLRALYDESASAAESQTFVDNLARLLLAGSPEVQGAVAEFMAAHFPASRHALMQTPEFSFALSMAASTADADLAKKLREAAAHCGAQLAEWAAPEL